jgi:ABC-type transport system involved in multi-copper enzyme maturation permease subunit
MYCSSCGTETKAGLSYCNRCGAKVEAKEGRAKVSELSPNFLVAAIVWVTIIGLGAIIALLGLLKKSPELAGVITVSLVLSFIIVLATEIMFAWLLVRSKTNAKAPDLSHIKGTDPRELEPGQAQMLTSPGVSVTERTTRTLEPVRSRQKTD